MPCISLETRILSFYLHTLELEAHELAQETVAGFLSKSVADLNVHLINVFSRDIVKFVSCPGSRASDRARSIEFELIRVHNEDNQLFTGIFVLQLSQQRYLMGRCPTSLL